VTLTSLIMNTVRGLKERRAFIATVRARAAAARTATADSAEAALAKMGGKGSKGASNT